MANLQDFEDSTSKKQIALLVVTCHNRAESAEAVESARG